MQGNPERNGVP